MWMDGYKERERERLWSMNSHRNERMWVHIFQIFVFFFKVKRRKKEDCDNPPHNTPPPPKIYHRFGLGGLTSGDFNLLSASAASASLHLCLASRFSSTSLFRFS